MVQLLQISMALNVGINGFGRIGRIIFRTFLQNQSLKAGIVSAINDPAVDIDYICYLIKFDSTHGKFKGTVERSDNEIVVDGYKISIFREKLPTDVPWQVADVQYVVEASGMFTNLEKASGPMSPSQGHLASDGVKRVLVTAPSLDVPMLVLGVNDDKLKTGHKVISCASSTLYCLAPIIKVLEDNFGVSEGFVTSIHAMTPSLKPLDGLCLKGKHWRDHRSIHQNIIPANTGACRALGKIIPQLKDKMTGLAFRVPIVNVSVLDLTIRLKTNATMDEVIRQVENAGKSNMKNVIKTSNEQAVSSDFIGDTYSCILDLNCSLQLTPDFFKLICWYENEYSYACRAMDTIFFLENQYQEEWQSNIEVLRPTPQPSFIQHTEFHKNMAYHQICSYDCNNNTETLSSTSHSGFKSPKRSLLTKKPLSCGYFESKQMSHDASKELKKNTELFKIWNDEDDTVRGTLGNRNSFFHSCVVIAPKIKENSYLKTQERLEKVKREFFKMATMTENLLKKSHHNKIEEISHESANDEAGDTIDNNLHIMHNESVSSLKDSCTDMQSNIYHLGEVISERINNNTNITPNNESIKHVSSIKENINKDRISGEIQNESIVSCPFVMNIDECLNEKRTVDNDHTMLSEVSNVTDNIQIEENATIFNNEHSMKSKDKEKYTESKISKISEEKNHIGIESSVTTPRHKDCLERSLNSNEENHECKERNVKKRLEDILKKLAVDAKTSINPSTSSYNSISKISNKEHKEDIYDKLDSVSATDSDNSFHMNERKSQVINITDLTNSLEDLERLDKICKIIEISDDLSDQLLSALNNYDSKELKNKKWSFKDLCDKIKLDEFCNQMFSKSNV